MRNGTPAVRLPIRALRVLAAAFCLTAAAGVPHAAAQEADAEGAVEPDAETVEAVDVAGFRSARFGMTEDEVIAAIDTDFGVADVDVSRELNVLEQTTALAITVDDLLPDTGTARVIYILGYRERTLIQVNVVWGAPVDDGYNPQQVVNAANILQDYFLGRGYADGTVFANLPLSQGSLLVFTGSDTGGRQVTLTLGGLDSAADSPEGDLSFAEMEATADLYLRLSYVETPSDPDVFRVEPGDF